MDDFFNLRSIVQNDSSFLLQLLKLLLGFIEHGDDFFVHSFPELLLRLFRLLQLLLRLLDVSLGKVVFRALFAEQLPFVFGGPRMLFFEQMKSRLSVARGFGKLVDFEV